MFPPLKQQRFADEFEPRRKFQGWVVEHRFQTIGGNVSSISSFVQVGLQINIGLDEEDIVNCVSRTLACCTR
jgi:hypothetical protein